ncbi:MAG: hypothetical protein ACYDEA_13330 [Candidatus Dormibacteria bacterium]
MAASLAGVALAFTGVMVSAQSTATVSGFEIAATSTEGQFVGTIDGGPLAGSFYANVYHQALSGKGTFAICGTGDPASGSCAGSAVSTVTVFTSSGSASGLFAYADDSSSVPPTGITNLTNPTGLCSGRLFSTSTQTYSVVDTITFSAASYSFDVTLTHYLINLPKSWGGCTTYAAQISGTLSS